MSCYTILHWLYNNIITLFWHHWFIYGLLWMRVTNINRMGMLKVILLALLFLIRLWFPLDKSITYVLRSRYGNLMVKELQKFEKDDYSLQKCKLDLTFLIACLPSNIVPKFLNFCVSNSYHACQIKLLKEEISLKKSRIRTGIRYYWFYSCYLFLTKNDRKLAHYQNITF